MRGSSPLSGVPERAPSFPWPFFLPSGLCLGAVHLFDVDGGGMEPSSWKPWATAAVPKAIVGKLPVLPVNHQYFPCWCSLSWDCQIAPVDNLFHEGAKTDKLITSLFLQQHLFSCEKRMSCSLQQATSFSSLLKRLYASVAILCTKHIGTSWPLREFCCPALSSSIIKSSTLQLQVLSNLITS